MQKVLPSSEGGGNVTAAWGDLGILSHSLGGDTLIQMLQQNHTFAKVCIMIKIQIKPLDNLPILKFS